MKKVFLNKRLFLIVFLLLLEASLFSQQLKDVILVDIPLNSAKTTAIEKLKQNGFELKERKENGDAKMLRYVRGGGFYGANAMVTLTEQNKKITEICWGCKNINAVQLELEEELDLSPYYSISGENAERLFYHWKGKTLLLERVDQAFIASIEQAVELVGVFGDYGLVNSDDVKDVNDIVRFPHSVIILSNENAGKMVQQHKDQIIQQTLKELAEEEQQRQRIERQKQIEEQQKRVHDSIQRENQRRLDSIQKENQRKMDSIRAEEQRQEKLRQERKREMLQPCKFLFNSDEEFVSCVMKENEAIEKEITSLIVKPLQVVYVGVANGKELRKESQAGRTELIQICEMCSQLKEMRTHYDGPEGEIVDYIYNYTEGKLGDFVLGRSALNKAYKKTPNSDYSSFLLSYMNGK